MFIMLKRSANILPYVLKAPVRFESLQMLQQHNAEHNEQISLNNFCANTGIMLNRN